MAEPTLTLTYAALRRWIGRELGWDRTPGNWTTNQGLDAPDIIDAGLRLAYSPPRHNPNKPAHKWSFLREVTIGTGNLSTAASYSTGTVTIVAGVVTLASGTFPSWAAQGTLIADGNSYDVSTRDGDTQVTLYDTTAAEAAGTSYVLARHSYVLPDSFGGFDGGITVRPGTSACDMKQTDEEHIRLMRQSYDVTGIPEWFAVRPKSSFDATTGQRWQLTLFPMAGAVYEYTYRFYVLPNTLDATNLYHRGGMPFSNLVVAACRYQAQSMLGPADKAQMRFQEFLTALQAAADYDVRFAPQTLGYNGDRSDGYSDGAVLYGPYEANLDQ